MSESSETKLNHKNESEDNQPNRETPQTSDPSAVERFFASPAYETWLKTARQQV